MPRLNPPPPSRIRTISLFTATSIVIANMVGVGVFTSLGFEVLDLKSGFPILVLWAIGGISALCGALVYGELASALPRSGGEYHLLSAIFHPSVGFLAGWVSITVGFAAPVALVAWAFGKYLHLALDSVEPLPIALVVVAIVTLVHLYGTKAGSAFQNVSTILKIALIAVMIAAGLLAAHPQPIHFLPQPGDWASISSAPFAVSLVYVMYSYSGWNATAYIVGEVKEPGRNVPLSVIFGTLIVGVLYVLLNGIFLRSAPIAEMAGKPEVAYVASAHLFGVGGGRLMAALICAGLISSVSAMIWIGPRVSVAMGEDWPALQFLAWKTKGGIPAVAILVQSAITVALLLLSSFETVLTYIQFGLTTCSFLTVAGVFYLRHRRPDLPRPCKAWGYPVTPLIFLAVNLWMLWYTMKAKPMESLAGLGTIALGLLIYLLCPRKKPRSHFESASDVLPAIPGES